jgi:hypothetical protein
MAVAKKGAAKVDTSVAQAGRIIEKIKRRRLATSATGIGTITIAVGGFGDAVTKIVELSTNSSVPPCKAYDAAYDGCRSAEYCSHNGRGTKAIIRLRHF